MKIKRFNNRTELKAGIYLLSLFNGLYEAEKLITVSAHVLTYNDQQIHNITMHFDLVNSAWRFNKLCKACGFNIKYAEAIFKSDNPETKAIIGSKVWAMVRNITLVDENGEIINEYNEVFEFYQFIDESKYPAIVNDPKKSDQPGEPFYVVRVINDTPSAVPEPLPMSKENMDMFRNPDNYKVK